MVKVSVIIPVYNTEDYLNECLDSIVNQSLKDIEIICINDGSTDNSLKILNKYANIDDRFNVFSQENKGQGSARNFGLKHAKGKYIYFMDSDDILELNALEDTYNICEENSLDFVIFKLSTYNEDTGENYNEECYTITPLKDYSGKIFNYNDIDDLIFNIPVSPVNKLYNGNFLRSLNVKFPENLIFEDNVIFWDILFNAKRISFYDEYLYIRRRHSSSSTGNIKNKNLIDTIKVNNLVIQKFIDYGFFNKYKKILYNRKFNSIYFRFSSISSEYKSLFFNEMKKDFLSMLNSDIYDGFFNYLDFKNKNIFNNVINAYSCDEFLLSMEFFELKNNNKHLKDKITMLNRDNVHLTKLINSLFNSRSWKITSSLRNIKK